MFRLESYSAQPLPSGQVNLWWMGQMGFIMKAGGVAVSIDYFASPREDRQVPPLIPAGELQGIDAFFGTHNHLDHMDLACWRVWKDTCPRAKFVFPAAHLNDVLALGIDESRCVPLNDGDTAAIGDLTVHAVAAAHEFLDQDPKTGFYPALQYILECGGVRVYHAGDTLRYEGMLAKLRAFAPYDAAILPINGRDAERYSRNCIGNMTFQEAVDLAGELEPYSVIPGHWDMFSANSADPRAFRDYLAVKYGDRIRCHIPAHGRQIVITRPDGRIR